VSPAAGWYADPIGVADLRLWDGERWSEQTRPCGPVRLSEPPRAKNGGRRVVMMGLALVFLVGLIVVSDRVTGSGSRSHSQNTSPTTLTSSPTAIVADCALPARRPSLTRVLAWLDTHGFQLQADPSTPPTPSHACGRLGFTARVGNGTITTYPSYRDAAAARPSGGFSAGIYVIALGPSLEAQLPSYRAAISRFMAVSDPSIPLAVLISPPS